MEMFGMVQSHESISRLAAEALPLLIDEKRLRCWVLNVFCGLMAKCPLCGEMLDGKACRTFLQLKRTRCRHCESTIYATQNSPLFRSRLTPEQFVLLAALAPVERENKKLRQSLAALVKSENSFHELRDSFGVGPAVNFENGSSIESVDSADAS